MGVNWIRLSKDKEKWQALQTDNVQYTGIP